MNGLLWAAIVFCVLQSAMFSGLNLALFSIARLRLEVEVSSGNPYARKVLSARKDSNFLLSTVLWGNVGINVLLTLLSDSVLSGAVAFVFSTFVITVVGEIMPQAYFSRHALRMGAALLPVLRVYQFLLWPLARPSGLLLDWWIGPEGIQFFRERNFRELIRKHIESDEADIDRLEGMGALNFLDIDDLLVHRIGVPVDERSIIALPMRGNEVVFPEFELNIRDPFVRQVEASGRKWVIIVDDQQELPRLVLDSDAFLRAVMVESERSHPERFCHRPIIVTDAKAHLGGIIARLKVAPDDVVTGVIDRDIILVWSHERRIITGADILGRLLRGISGIEVSQ